MPFRIMYCRPAFQSLKRYGLFYQIFVNLKRKIVCKHKKLHSFLLSVHPSCLWVLDKGLGVEGDTGWKGKSEKGKRKQWRMVKEEEEKNMKKGKGEKEKGNKGKGTKKKVEREKKSN